MICSYLRIYEHWTIVIVELFQSMKSATSKNSETVINFGEKRIPRQNYSRVIILDKTLLQNCGCDVSANSEIKAKVELVKKPDENFIKVTPFCEKVTQDEIESKDSGDKN